MELYLIRHGQSASNANPANKTLEPPLTELGERQARRAGSELADRGIVRLYCSPMLRALQTARLIAEPLGLVPHVFVGLHEWYSQRDYHGLTRQQMMDVCPDVVLPEDVTDGGWYYYPWVDIPTMLVQVGKNARRFLVHLERHHPEPHERVAVVSHGGFLSTLISTFYGLEPDDDPDRFAHRNAAISKVRRIDGLTQLRYMSRLSHLDDDMVW